MFREEHKRIVSAGFLLTPTAHNDKNRRTTMNVKNVAEEFRRTKVHGQIPSSHIIVDERHAEGVWDCATDTENKETLKIQKFKKSHQQILQQKVHECLPCAHNSFAIPKDFFFIKILKPTSALSVFTVLLQKANGYETMRLNLAVVSWGTAWNRRSNF